MMIRAEIDIALTVEGPFLTKSTGPGGYDTDMPFARDSEGRLCLPGTHVAGKLLQAWQEISSVGEGLLETRPEEWLGTGSNEADKNSDWSPNRKRLVFGDFHFDGRESHGADFRYRIQIEKERGAVKKGAHLMIESPFASGETAIFTGTADLLVKDDAELAEVRRAMEIGLKWIPQLGGLRSIGFGRLKGVQVEIDSEKLSRIATPVTPADDVAPAFDLLIRPMAPFCISRRRVAENLYESEEVIPGGVIKGAISETWAMMLGKLGVFADKLDDPLRRELGAHFEHIRVSHAFPGATCLRRPVVPPLSLIMAKGELYDVALRDGPGLIDGSAPAFRVDWKDASQVFRRYGWPSLRRELRVRTKIDPDNRRSEKEKLFAYEMVVPGDTVWYARVDLSAILDDGERAKVRAQLESVLTAGLFGLGKTKARAEVEAFLEGTAAAHCEREGKEPIEGQWVVTLQTPALLCDPSNLPDGAGKLDLSAEYRRIWHELSGDTMELVRYFASQSLAGGEYLFHRFMKGSGGYRPYLLTDPGSVFVLKPAAGKADAAQEKIKQWECTGLDLPGWCREAYERNGSPGDHWSNCPFIPQNGYGEITVNLKDHWELDPGDKFEPVTRALTD